eukprot:522010_1
MLDEINDIIVFGYCRKMQKLMPTDTYFNIPDVIIKCVLIYFYVKRCFSDGADMCLISSSNSILSHMRSNYNRCVIVNGVYGIYRSYSRMQSESVKTINTLLSQAKYTKHKDIAYGNVTIQGIEPCKFTWNFTIVC